MIYLEAVLWRHSPNNFAWPLYKSWLFVCKFWGCVIRCYSVWSLSSDYQKQKFRSRNLYKIYHAENLSKSLNLDKVKWVQIPKKYLILLLPRPGNKRELSEGEKCSALIVLQWAWLSLKDEQQAGAELGQTQLGWEVLRIN